MGAIKLDILNKSFRLQKVEDNFLNISKKACAGVYVFGFNGMEKDDEIFNVTGSSYTAEFWQYDSRLGRRWNTDPVRYAWQSSYAAFNNNPIYFSDPLGLEGTDPPKGYKDNGKGTATKTNTDGTTWTMKQGADGNWTGTGGDMGTLPEVTVGAEAPKTVDYSNYSIKGLENKINGLSSNPIYRYMQLNNIHSFGSGIKWGNGLNPEQQARHDQWMSGIYAMTYGLHIAIGATVALPMAIEAIPTASVKGVSLFSTKLWAGKATISFFSQMLMNNGNVNIVGLTSDALTAPGFGSLVFNSGVSSAFELNINMYDRGKITTRSVFGSKSVTTTALQMGTSMLIGTKVNFLSKQANNAGKIMILAPNAFGTQGLNRLYDKKASDK